MAMEEVEVGSVGPVPAGSSVQHQSGHTLGIEEIEANRPAGSCG